MSVPRLLRRAEVTNLTGLSTARIYEQMGEGDFPRPVRTGVRAVAWVESEIADWNRERIAERDEAEANNKLQPSAIVTTNAT